MAFSKQSFESFSNRSIADIPARLTDRHVPTILHPLLISPRQFEGQWRAYLLVTKGKEADYAFAVRQWLIDQRGWGPDDIFVDLDHLRGGVEWAKKLFAEAEACQAMLFLASEGALHPKSFCYRELRRSGGPIIAVTIGNLAPDNDLLHMAIPHESLSRQITALDQQPVTGIDFVRLTDNTRGTIALNAKQLESIHDVMRDLGVAPNSFTWTPNDDGPYPGLRPLQEGDEALFCGRDVEIRDGLRELETFKESVTDRALIIQAPSGAGKSSFLRAGPLAAASPASRLYAALHRTTN